MRLQGDSFASLKAHDWFSEFDWVNDFLFKLYLF